MKLLRQVFSVLFVLAGPAGAQTGPCEAGKARLVAKLSADMRARQAQIDGLLVIKKEHGVLPSILRAIKGKKLEEDKIFISAVPKLLDEAVRSRKTLKAFLEEIKKEEAGRVPALLKSVFLSCGQNGCSNGLDYSGVADCITVFGGLALQPLLDGMSGLNAVQKEDVLNLMPSVEPQCPKAVLDGALADPVFRVRSAALNVFKKNCAPSDFHQRLNGLLAGETNPEFLLSLLEQAPDESGQGPRVYDRLIRLVQDKRIPVDMAFGKLCTVMAGETLDASALDMQFWLNAFESHKARQGCLAEHIFLKAAQEDQLVKIRRLFVEAAEHRYRFSSEQMLFDQTSGASSFWDSIPGADEKMLALFKKRLSIRALRVWRSAPDTPLGERLLLTQWLGGDMSAQLPRKLRLKIEVSSPSGVVSAAEQDVALDRPFLFTLRPLVPDFPEISYKGTAYFDAGKLSYGISWFTVGLKPSPAACNPMIPLTGALAMDLFVQEKKYRWKLSLVPAVNGAVGGLN